MKITEILALASATAFTLTVSYTYGFSRSIEVNLITYFNINDYIKYSIYWLPMSLVGPGIGFCLAKMKPPLFGIGSSLEDKIAKYPNTSSFGKFLFKHEEKVLSISVMGTSIVVILFIIFCLFPEHLLHICYCLLGSVLWAAFFKYYLKPGLVKEWVSWKGKALLLGPIVIVGVYVSGILSGLSDIARAEKHPTEILEITSMKTNKKGRLLFALSQYVVFLEQKAQMVEIIPVSQVKTIIPIPKEKKNKKQLKEARKGTTK